MDLNAAAPSADLAFFTAAGAGRVHDVCLPGGPVCPAPAARRVRIPQRPPHGGPLQRRGVRAAPGRREPAASADGGPGRRRQQRGAGLLPGQQRGAALEDLHFPCLR